MDPDPAECADVFTSADSICGHVSEEGWSQNTDSLCSQRGFSSGCDSVVPDFISEGVQADR